MSYSSEKISFQLVSLLRNAFVRQLIEDILCNFHLKGFKSPKKSTFFKMSFTSVLNSQLHKNGALCSVLTSRPMVIIRFYEKLAQSLRNQDQGSSYQLSAVRNIRQKYAHTDKCQLKLDVKSIYQPSHGLHDRPSEPMVTGCIHSSYIGCLKTAYVDESQVYTF